MKLAIGTAQFGLNYGIANNAGKMTLSAAGEILQFAQTSGIDTLDTAIAYGDSEAVLGVIGVRSWKVITKLPPVPVDCSDVMLWVEENVSASLQKLGVPKLYGLMLHRPDQLLGDLGLVLYRSLMSIKAKGLVQKIGISVYEPFEIESVFSRYTLDLVQSPLSVLDRRLVDTGWAEKLHKSGVEVHVRSIFLQGLLLMPASLRPAKFESWVNIWQEWDRWLESSQLTPLQACVRYLQSISSVDKIIVGIDSLSQLKEILIATQGRLQSLPEFKTEQIENLINPARWNQL
jgi:aryl-alcohol dehydrogenase-like predicted oxidoreductase